MKSVIHFYRTNQFSQIRYFYGEKLGFHLVKDQGKCLIYNAYGLGLIGFCQHFPAQMADSTCITFVVSTMKELRAKHEEISAWNNTTTAITESEEFRITHFFIKDFENRNLEYQLFWED